MVVIIPAPENVEKNLEMLKDVPVRLEGPVDPTDIEDTGESPAAYQNEAGQFIVEQSGGGQLVFKQGADAGVFYQTIENLPDSKLESLGPESFEPVGTGMSESEAIAELQETELRVSGDELSQEDLATFTEAGLESDRTFTSRQGDRVSLTLYDADRTSPVEGVPSLEFSGGSGSGPIGEFLRAVRTVGADEINPDAIGRDEELIDRAEDRDTRRATREAARDAAADAGVDLDAYDVGATAGGEVILQDADTGRSRRIDPAEASGGLASAIDAETSGGGFVADAADPAAGASGSGDGLGARAAGAVVLLFGAIAAALGLLS